MPQVSGYNVQWCGTHTRFVDGAVVEPMVEPVVEQPPTLIDVPFDTLMVYLLPFLDAKHLCLLSMAHPILNQFCSQNTVWAAVYGRKIVDTSVHNGCCLNALCMPSKLHSRVGSRLHWFNIEARKGRMDCSCLETASKWNGIGCSFCQAIYAKRGGGPWGGWMDIPGQILALWSIENGKNGLSTTNLCQCLDHYQVETLGFETPKLKSKNFKNLVKKQYKQKIQKKLNVPNRKLNGLNKKIVKARQIIDALEVERANHAIEVESIKTALEKFD